jgi:phage gp36-like protein
MAYITQAELVDYITEKELVQLTDDAKLGVIDAAKVTVAINGASSDIDAYAGLRYAVPLQPSEKIKELCRDLAIWRLESRRRKIREATQLAYDNAIAFLKDLATGKAVLDQPAGEEAQSSSAGVAATEKSPKIFTDDTLKEF